MRELKFKVWDKEVKRMSLPMHHTDPVVKWGDGDVDMPAPFANNPDRFEWLQYIGAKDKAGTEIYEGNCLNDPEEPDVLVLVEWNVYGFMFKDLIYGNDCFGEDVHSCAEFLTVCGNSHQNPELLDQSA